DLALQGRDYADPGRLIGGRHRPLSRRARYAMRAATKLFLVLLGGILVTTTGFAQKSATLIDIAAMPAGAPPPGFAVARTGSGAAAEWRVVADPTGGAGKVIAQTSTDTTDYRFPLAIYEGVVAANLDVVVRFKPIAGRIDQAGGIALRLASPDDYYCV